MAQKWPKMAKNGQKSEKIGASIVKKLIMVDSINLIRRLYYD